jgi:hydrogenase maturation protease
MGHSLILGIGNVLLSDEGVGVHALQYIDENYPDLADVRYIDGGTLSFTLSSEIAEADHLIAIDAARLDAAPGTVRSFQGIEMDKFLGTKGCSVHEVGLLDLIDIAHLENLLPEQRALIGVQPQYIEWGDSLSESVDQSLPVVAQQVLSLLQSWRKYHNLVANS